jgi:hypothetical protein
MRCRRAELQTDQRALGRAQISHDAAQGLGKPPHERWDRDDLVACRELRLFEEVDQLDLIAPREVLFAEPLEVGIGSDRLWRLSCDVLPELPRFGLGAGATSGNDLVRLTHL